MEEKKDTIGSGPRRLARWDRISVGPSRESGRWRSGCSAESPWKPWPVNWA